MAKELQEWLDTDVAELKKIDKKKLYEETFFRDPIRPNIIDSDYFFAPADGIILYQKQVKPDEEILDIKGQNYHLRSLLQDDNFDKECLVVSVFMSMYDVHINRLPFPGVVQWKALEEIATKNRPMLDLENDILADEVKNADMDYMFYNERHLNTVICPQLNYKYYVVQVADVDVNAIEHFYGQDKPMYQNQRFGNIRYGSECILILPIDDRFEFELMQEEQSHVEAGVDALCKISKVV